MSPQDVLVRDLTKVQIFTGSIMLVEYAPGRIRPIHGKIKKLGLICYNIAYDPQNLYACGDHGAK